MTAKYKQDYLRSEYDIARCCYKLLDAPLFRHNQEYVRRQILYSLLQEDYADTLHTVAAVLLFDGRANESTCEMMQAEGAFPRLIELIRRGRDDDAGLHRLLLELLFVMSRIQQLSREDLSVVDDSFILYLFQLIEELSDDADDPYHYPIIRVLLVLNEQHMCLASTQASSSGADHAGVTNRILKLLSMHGPSYRTFGENLILLLNRETELGRQLMILKLLYLLFTTPATYEYFYTNDLHVLVDVIIRNLLDLDPGSGDSALAPDMDGQRALRHTYLRVLCPLLKNTQLAHEGNHYKREEVRRLLYLLVNRPSAHFSEVDETVNRLVLRCKQIDWLREEGDDHDQATHPGLAQVSSTEPQTDVANKVLGMSVADAGVSTLSVADVSAKIVKEKPRLPPPRRLRKGSKVSANDEMGSSITPATMRHGAEVSPKTLRVPPTPPRSKYGRVLHAGHVGAGIPRGDTSSPFADENAAT